MLIYNVYDKYLKTYVHYISVISRFALLLRIPTVSELLVKGESAFNTLTALYVKLCCAAAK